MRQLFFIAILFGTLTGLAQTPNYFAGSPEWRLWRSCAIPYPCIETHDFVYYLNGDSIVEGIQYHKLYSRGELSYYDYYDPGVPHTCSGFELYHTLSGLIRQDERKILKHTGVNYPDEVIYDFNMEVGDTIPYSGHITIDNIDTIQFAGESRLRFWLNGAQSQHLIEGVGHDLGFFVPIQSGYFDCGFEFACFKQFDDTLLFPSQTISCDFSVDITEIKPLISRLYPNPFTDQLNLEMAQRSDIDRITALDLNGRQVELSHKRLGDMTYQIETSRLLTGVYLLKLTMKNGDPLTMKIQKK